MQPGSEQQLIEQSKGFTQQASGATEPSFPTKAPAKPPAVKPAVLASRASDPSAAAAALYSTATLEFELDPPAAPTPPAGQPVMAGVGALKTAYLNSGAVRVALAALAAGGWMIVSSFLILLNKYIMVDLGFRYPMFVSGMGMLTSGALSWVVCRIFRIVEPKTAISWHFWATKILPVGLFMAGTLWTGNEVYLYLTVAFIQMLKAFTPVITMLCLFVARLEDPTSPMIASVLLTAGGVALAAYGEINMSIVGMLFMLTSETCEAIRLVSTQYLLVGLKFHPIEGLMYLAPACCLWLTLGSAILEWRSMREANALQIIFKYPGLFSMAAVMGFIVNTLAYTTIKLASSLTLKVLGTVKNALLVVVGVIFLGEVVTGTQSAGYAISLLGFGWYNQVVATRIASSVPVSPKAAPPDGEKQPLLRSGPSFKNSGERN